MFYIIYIIVLGVVLFINHLIAAAFYDIAVSKGHSERRYYWLSFWLGVVGYCLVAALPDLKARPAKNNEPMVSVAETDTKVEAKKEEIKEQSNLLDIFKTDNDN